MNISVRIEIFKEEDVYVALSPELNVSSLRLLTMPKSLSKRLLRLLLKSVRRWGHWKKF